MITKRGIRSRWWVPTLLLLTGAVLLVGCLPLPGPWQPPDGEPRPEDRIGKKPGKRELTLHLSTRADVERVLGVPPWVTGDRRAAGYPYTIVTGTILVCFVYPDVTEERRLLLVRYDDAGRLAGYKVYHDPDEAARKTGQPLIENPRKLEESQRHLQEYHRLRQQLRDPEHLPPQAPRY